MFSHHLIKNRTVFLTKSSPTTIFSGASCRRTQAMDYGKSTASKSAAANSEGGIIGEFRALCVEMELTRRLRFVFFLVKVNMLSFF